MRVQNSHGPFLTLIAFCVSVAIISASCGHHEGKLDPNRDAPDASGAPGNVARAGAGQGGAPPAEPEMPSNSGAGGNAVEPIPSGGAPSQPSACIYHLDVESDAGGATVGGQGGAAPVGEAGQGGEFASPTVAKATNRLIGDYLTDASGRALYVFGADLAGTCEFTPVSSCEGDCVLSWPIFHAEPRVLAAGLDEAAFGSILRADGLPQTTYFGWPLYYYANDAQPGDVTGHGSGVWGLAELILPNVVVRRVGMDRLLADGAGRTLYAFADDTRGTSSSAPASACSAACLEAHPPFAPSYVGAISTLEPRDFTSFVRGDGSTQVAYKGAPLYYSLLDSRPGAVNGAEEEGFTIVLK